MEIFVDAGDKPSVEQPEHLQKYYSDDELQAVIDPLLLEWDLNRDGLIEYTEFKERF